MGYSQNYNPFLPKLTQSLKTSVFDLYSINYVFTTQTPKIPFGL